MLPVLAAVAPPATEPPGIFARATADEPLERTTFVLPGFTYVGWQPVKVDEPNRVPSSGAGVELSVVRWLTSGTYVGGVAQFERLDRYRTALGIEAGYQLVGVELGVAREFGNPGRDAQWSLQIAPYASIGMIYVSPRWVLALSNRSSPIAPGDGAMLAVGIKLPIRVGGP